MYWDIEYITPHSTLVKLQERKKRKERKKNLPLR